MRQDGIDNEAARGGTRRGVAATIDRSDPTFVEGEKERSLSSGPPACWLRILYNWRDETRLGGRTLIGTDPDVCTKKGVMLLVLIALLATVSYLTGCGGAGSGSTSEGSGQQRATRTVDSTE